ncbi:MAG: ABC transporter permease [Betaproteobacteria bacterium]|nr:ABC transporter permease [Betaproteobacteria bacterium]
MAASAVNGAAVLRLRVLTLVLLLGSWEIVARSGWLYEDVVPPLWRIAVAFARLIADAQTWRHLGVTGWEVVAGFSIGYLLGAVFGMVAGAWRFFGDAVAPWVDGVATAPKIVFLPIVMLLAGTGIASKIALGALSSFFPVAINTAAGVRQLNPVYARVGRSFRLSAWNMATRVYLPALRESLVTSMRLGFGLAVVGVLLSEIKLSNAGLGYLANEHYSQFRVPDLYAVILLIFVLAVGSNSLMGRLLRRHPSPEK